jgi:hypothetical protein
MAITLREFLLILQSISRMYHSHHTNFEGQLVRLEAIVYSMTRINCDCALPGDPKQGLKQVMDGCQCRFQQHLVYPALSTLRGTDWPEVCIQKPVIRRAASQHQLRHVDEIFRLRQTQRSILLE